jgi:hypothetical protein
MTDFTFTDHGSITLLVAQSAAAKAWVDEHLPADAQRWGANQIVIEPRYVGPILQGLSDDGLTVST